MISAFAGPELQYVADGRTHTLRPDAVVLATGVREKLFPFEGWTLPGVMGAGGAQAILKTHMAVPGRRIVIAGAGPLPMVVAAQMIRAGAEVKALVELQSLRALVGDPLALLAGRDSVVGWLGYLATVLRARTPRLPRYVPIRAEGEQQVRSVTLVQLDHSGEIIAGKETTIETDVLALNYGFVANAELAAMFGVEMRFDEITGWHPRIDDNGRTSISGVFACGDTAGLRGSFVAEAEGRIVGAAAAAEVQGRTVDEAAHALRASRTARARHLRFQAALRKTLTLPTGVWRLATPGTVVCRCESVTKQALSEAFGQGHLSVDAAKRNTRAGMGWCGGRSCLHSVSAMASAISGEPPRAPMTPRPLARPVSLADLANALEDGG